MIVNYLVMLTLPRHHTSQLRNLDSLGKFGFRDEIGLQK